MRFKDEAIKQEEYFKSMSKGEKKIWLDFASGFRDDTEVLKGLEIEQELFFQSYSSEIEFSVFQDRVNTLLLYLKKNKSFIDDYVSISQEKLKESHSKNISGESSLVQTEAFYNIDNYFSEYLYVSIISILYSILETTLKNIVLLLGEKENNEFLGSREKKSTIEKYLKFINVDCNLDFNLPNDFWFELTTMRKVRNNFTHSMDDDIINQIRGYKNKNSYKSFITYDFSMKCFGVSCELIDEIEQAICKRYPESRLFSKIQIQKNELNNERN